MVFDSVFSSAASTSSLASLVASVYLTRKPDIAASVPSAIRRWDLADAGVPDQAQRLALLDPLALGQGVDDRGIDAGVGLEVEAA
jgi:hypothetical protein